MSAAFSLNGRVALSVEGPAVDRNLTHFYPIPSRPKQLAVRKNMNVTNAFIPAQSLPVFPADMFRVVEGANLGDPISFAADLMLDDIYSLERGVAPQLLTMIARADHSFLVSVESACGTEGARLVLDCRVTLMSPDGQTTDALILVELDINNGVTNVFLAPLAALATRTRYVLVGVDRDTAVSTLAEVCCARFVRGTHISLASGAQVPIEELQVGDRVLTRDDGPQEVRWIGVSTVRAVGDFSPVCISAGALNNDQDLIVSPNHRLFIYQRTDQLGAGRSELLVKARHLVNGDTIQRHIGGFVDYFQLLFDRHVIVYAEGIAAESMLIDTVTKPSVPPEVTKRLQDTSALSPAPIRGLDVTEDLLNRPDAAELLRRASSRQP